MLVANICVGTVMIIGGFRMCALATSEGEPGNTVTLLTRHLVEQFEDAENVATAIPRSAI